MAESITSDGFEITSNYQSAQDMEAALPPPPDHSADTGPADPQPADAADAKPEAAAPLDKPKPRNDPRARVEQATAKEAEAKREAVEARKEAAELRQRLEALERRPAPAAAEPEKAEKPEPDWKRYRGMADAPKMAQFDGETAFEDWQAAMALFIADKRIEERGAQQQQTAQRQRYEQAETEHRQNFVKQRDQWVKDDPQFFDRIDPRLINTPCLSMLPPGTQPTFGNWLAEQVYRSNASKELLEHYSANWDDVQRLATLHPGQAALEIARLEGRLASPAAPLKTGTAAAPSKSSASAPIQPVRSSSQSASDGPPGDDASDETHDAYWGKVRRKYRA